MKYVQYFYLSRYSKIVTNFTIDLAFGLLLKIEPKYQNIDKYMLVLTWYDIDSLK